MFNIQKFNIKNDSDNYPILLSETFRDSFMASLFPTIEIYEQVHVYDGLNCDFYFTVGLLLKDHFTDEMGTSVFGNSYTVSEETYHTSLNSKIHVTKDIYCDLELDTDFEVIANLAKDSNYSELFSDSLKIETRTTKDIRLNLSFTDILNTSIMADIFDRNVTTINISIPPNGVLEIDSDNYTVYLNDENVFDTYTGNWIFLDRSVIELIVEVGNNRTVSGNIVYREMYL